MLRIEGVECGGGGGSGGGSGIDSQSSGEAASSSSRDRERGPDAGADEYPALVEEFERRMVTLRKVVGASEDRRQKIGAETAAASASAAGLGGGDANTSTSQQSLQVPGRSAAE